MIGGLEGHWRYDWWRVWVACRREPVHRRALSVTVRIGVTEWTLGYRRKGWVE